MHFSSCNRTVGKFGLHASFQTEINKVLIRHFVVKIIFIENNISYSLTKSEYCLINFFR